MRVSVLKPGSQRFFDKPIYGFDVETTGKNNKFYMCSIYSEIPGRSRFFYDKNEFIEHIKKHNFRDSVIAASNLGFDFFSVFFEEEAVRSFDTLFRGSNLLYAKTYIKHGTFNRKRIPGSKRLIFLDTMNYAGLSVEKLGKLIKINKMEKPSFLGKKPVGYDQKAYLEKYNMRDSEISSRGLKFFFDSFKELGASQRNTIAATSMSLFRNKYLKKDYFRHDPHELDNEFLSYYGGRTEAFYRGKIEDLNYYDVNSLYPYVMQKFEFPDPNSMRKTRKHDLELIHAYHGISRVIVNSPLANMNYPLLPLRHDNKLLFPLGRFSGWYTHVELRKALELGYTIEKMLSTYYFKEVDQPFKEYVDDMYNLRKELRNKGNPMEYVVKILMNSLYGKFGQKFRDRDNWIPVPETYEELIKLDIYERIGKYIRIKKDFSEPASFCIPIWASYCTAYARMHLHNLMMRSQPFYVDTDSIMTPKKMITGDDIGDLKLEMRIHSGIIVKPKMYAIRGDRGDHVRIKGLGTKLVFKDFQKLLIDKKIDYTKFTKFKEALRRGLDPNEIIPICKNFDLEDNKRFWEKPFDFKELQVSHPLLIAEGREENRRVMPYIVLSDTFAQDS